ncbi:unnamed protein product, partial [Bubo scandiacus]
MYKATRPALPRQDVTSAWYLNNPARAPSPLLAKFNPILAKPGHQDSEAVVGWVRVLMQRITWQLDEAFLFGFAGAGQAAFGIGRAFEGKECRVIGVSEEEEGQEEGRRKKRLTCPILPAVLRVRAAGHQPQTLGKSDRRWMDLLERLSQLMEIAYQVDSSREVEEKKFQGVVGPDDLQEFPSHLEPFCSSGVTTVTSRAVSHHRREKVAPGFKAIPSACCFTPAAALLKRR